MSNDHINIRLQYFCKHNISNHTWILFTSLTGVCKLKTKSIWSNTFSRMATLNRLVGFLNYFWSYLPFLGLPLIVALLENIYSAINCVEWNSVSKIWINCTSFKYFYRCMYLNTYGRNWWILNFQKSRGSLISPGIEPMMRALTTIK